MEVAAKACFPGAISSTSSEIGEQPARLRVQHAMPRRAGTIPKGLHDVALAGAHWTTDDHRLAGIKEMAGGQVPNLCCRDLWVEAEVEVLQRLHLLEPGLADAAGQAPLRPALDLVFPHQFPELQGAQLVFLGLVQTSFQGIRHSSQAQSFEFGL